MRVDFLPIVIAANCSSSRGAADSVDVERASLVVFQDRSAVRFAGDVAEPRLVSRTALLTTRSAPHRGPLEPTASSTSCSASR